MRENEREGERRVRGCGGAQMEEGEGSTAMVKQLEKAEQMAALAQGTRSGYESPHPHPHPHLCVSRALAQVMNLLLLLLLYSRVEGRGSRVEGRGSRVE
eukprot:1701064-Rhodomonas_salina.1